jgi:hypothetical protein
VSSRQSTARFFGVQRQQLLSESKVFQNEILTGTKSTENPTEKVPESQDHGRKFIGIRGTKPLSKWLIPRVCEVLTRHIGFVTENTIPKRTVLLEGVHQAATKVSDGGHAAL